jgi:hypothetical protein
LADLGFEIAQLGHFPELMFQLLDPLLQVGQHVLLVLQRLLHTVQLKIHRRNGARRCQHVLARGAIIDVSRQRKGKRTLTSTVR